MKAVDGLVASSFYLYVERHFVQAQKRAGGRSAMRTPKEDRWRVIDLEKVVTCTAPSAALAKVIRVCYVHVGKCNTWNPCSE